MKIIKTGITLVFLLTVSKLQAGKVERAFEALAKYDYFGAKELFEKVKGKEPVAAPYGLSIIFGRDDNPFYDLDSAYHYVVMSERAYPEQDMGAQEDLQELGINDSTIAQWKDSVDLKAWKVSKLQNTLKSYQKFIDQHHDADQFEKAKARRNEIAFAEARELDRSRGYRIFMDRYPEAAQYTEAQNRYESRLFEELTEEKSLSSYEQFIKLHPESPYVREAQDSIYAISTRVKNIQTYEDFISDYPNNPNIDQAWRNIYKLFTAEYSPQRIVEFRIAYPDYPFVDELKTDMKLAAKVFFPYRENGTYGYMDQEGNQMVAAQYDVVEAYTEGLGLVVKDGKLGFLNKAGEMIIPLEYEDGEPFFNGLAIVSKNELYGIIDRTNKAVIPFKYDLVGQYSDELALVANDTAYGYVNRDAEEVIPITLDYANDFENGYAVVEIDRQKGIINTLGRTVIEAKYSWIENFNQYQVCRAKNDSAYGLIDKQGAEILPFIYDRIGEFTDSLALIAKGGQYGYVNYKGEIVINLDYDFNTEAMVWGNFENAYVKFKKGEKYGILNIKGEEVFPAIFEDVGKYSKDQLIAVKKRGEWGYSDQNLKLQIPYQYELSETFIRGKGKVKTEEGWQLINADGEFLLDSAYEHLEYIDSLILIKQEGLLGLMDQELNLLLGLEYDLVKPYKYHFLELHKGEELLYYDPENKKIIAIKEE